MRLFLFAGVPLLLIALSLGTLFQGTSAAEPPKNDPAQIEPGGNCTVHYLLGSDVDQVKNCEYLGRTADWLVVSDRGQRKFLALKNVMRIDVSMK